MLASLNRAAAVVAAIPILAIAAEPVALSESTYKPEMGIVIIQVNWGRYWKCGQFENAQLQSLAFTKSPLDSKDTLALDLVTPSKLFVDNKYLPYALVVQPGEYVMTGFDVKVARSVSDVAHIKGTKENLIKDGKAIGGTFSVSAGEAVYLGHFGLDCSAEPFLWRNFINGRADFERYVAGFRARYPFVKQTPVHFRLFSTQLFGMPSELKDPVIK